MGWAEGNVCLEDALERCCRVTMLELKLLPRSNREHVCVTAQENAVLNYCIVIGKSTGVLISP